jgi:hypothetical protein
MLSFILPVTKIEYFYLFLKKHVIDYLFSEIFHKLCVSIYFLW